jgi:hypothetical protein
MTSIFIFRSNNEKMNHFPCEEADSIGRLTERSTHNDNGYNKDMTRREDHYNSSCCQEINNNFHENKEKVNEENITVDKCDNCCRKQNHLLINKYGDMYELIFHQMPIQ